MCNILIMFIIYTIHTIPTIHTIHIIHTIQLQFPSKQYRLLTSLILYGANEGMIDINGAGRLRDLEQLSFENRSNYL